MQTVSKSLQISHRELGDCNIMKNTLTSTMENKNNLYQRYASHQEFITEKYSQKSVVDNQVECDNVSVDSYNDDYFELFLQDLDNEDKAIQPVLDCSADNCNETLDEEISKLEMTLLELEEDNLSDFEDEGKLALNTTAVTGTHNRKSDQNYLAGDMELLKEDAFLNEKITNNSTAHHFVPEDKSGNINDNDLSDNLSSTLLNTASKTQRNEESVLLNSTEFNDPDEGRVPEDQSVQFVASSSSLKPKHLFLGEDFVVLDECGDTHSDEVPLSEHFPVHSASRTPVGKENITSECNFRRVNKLDLKALNLATEAENVAVEHSLVNHEFTVVDEYRAMSNNELTPSHFNSSFNIGPVISHNFHQLDLVSQCTRPTSDKKFGQNSSCILTNQTSEKIESLHSLDSIPDMNNENNPNVGNIKNNNDGMQLPGSQVDTTTADLNLLKEDKVKSVHPITDESKSRESQNLESTSFTTSSVDELHSIEIKATVGDNKVDSPDVLQNDSKEAEKSIADKNEIEGGKKQETAYVETVIQPADEDFVSNDPQENADNNNPEWEVLRKLETDEERYKAMRQRWRSLVIPDPNQNLTFLHCKYRPNKECGVPASSNPLRENETQKSKKRKRNKTVEPSSSANDNPSKRLRTKSCTTIFDRKVEELQRTVEDKKHQLRVEEQLALENLGAQQSVEHLQLLNSHINPYRFAILRDQLYQRQREDFELLRERYAHAQLSAEVEVKSKMDAIMKAMEEVRAFHSFYQGLDSEATNKNCLLLTDTELEDILDYERLDEKYKIFYK